MFGLTRKSSYVLSICCFGLYRNFHMDIQYCKVCHFQEVHHLLVEYRLLFHLRHLPCIIIVAEAGKDCYTVLEPLDNRTAERIIELRCHRKHERIVPHQVL